MTDNAKDFIPSRDKLMEMRFDKNMTREEIADHFEVSIATVRRWVRELEIPRPKSKKQRSLVRPYAASGDVINSLDDSRTAIERAHIILGGRLVEMRGSGYYLDGVPSSIDTILRVSAEARQNV
jgi:hypothetical protein